MSKSILHLDLHPLAHNSKSIDEALQTLIAEAIKKRVNKAEIIPGKGSGALMNRVKKWLNQKEIRNQYKRLEIDDKNYGRIFVHFR